MRKLSMHCVIEELVEFVVHNALVQECSRWHSRAVNSPDHRSELGRDARRVNGDILSYG